MGEDSGASTYILGTEERRRLELLEQCLDPMTARSLDCIGVEPGWRCLELGGGGGSVTRMLCDRVGPEGRVAAVDLDTRFLGEIDADNLEVYRQNLITDGLPGDAYDLVHARLLLMHLPTREKLVEEMASVLRPGGWLLVEDMDSFPFAELAEGAFAEVWNGVIRALDNANATARFGRQLPDLFDRAGLEEVEPVCEVPVFRGDSHFSGMFMASAAQMGPLLAASGITEEQLAEFAREMADRTRWFSGFAFYSVRGRTPAA
jgi:SAM-dependent methyltransferase